MPAFHYTVGGDLQVLAVGSEDMLCRPCVDCGTKTGNFCDHCYGADRVPSEQWAEGQHTPLCTTCDEASGMCHFCRGVAWCTPFTKW